jgi:hypothetical protein
LEPVPIPAARPFLNGRIVAVAILVGLLIGACGVAVDQIVHGVHKLYASDAYTCIVAGALSYALLVYEKRRRMILDRRMQIAAEVNHHIRNALTAVVFSASVQNDPTLHTVLEDATARIDWVLTTVLSDGKDDLKWPVQAKSWRPRLWRGKPSVAPDDRK